MDSQFSDAIDGLIVDMMTTETKTLQKRTGKEEAMAHLSYRRSEAIAAI